jgi:hypothetical protein
VLVASALSEITEAITSTIGDYGLYAVFLLMLVDAVLPAASEVVMVYGGAVAAGRRSTRVSPPTSRSSSPERSATRSDRSPAGRSGSTAGGPTSSATGAGCT